MEARLGADFSDVRIHDDSAARSSAAEIGARAYTSGSHVVIGDGGGDKHTLAHELTHVIQQRQGPVAATDNGSGLRVSDPSDRFEREAEANATRVMSEPVPDSAPLAGPHPDSSARPAVPASGPVTVARLTSARAFKEQSQRPGKTSQFRSRLKELTALDELLETYPGLPGENATNANYGERATALTAIRNAAEAALAKDLKPSQAQAVRALLDEAVPERMLYEGLSNLSDRTREADLVGLIGLYERALPHLQTAEINSDLSLLVNRVSGKLTQRLGGLLDTVREGGAEAAEANATLTNMLNRDMNALVAMAQDGTLPKVTRDTLTEVTSQRGKVTLSQGMPGTKKEAPGDYRMKHELNQSEGKIERLGSLAHELTHVAAGESYDNTSILLLCQRGLSKQEMLKLAKERAGHARNLTSLLTDDMVTSRQQDLIENKIAYTTRSGRMLSYIGSFKAQLKSEVGEEQFKELEEVAMEEMEDSATLVEYDTVLTQLLVYLHSWEVPENHPFYKEVRRLAQAQRNSRLSAMTA